MARRLRPAPVCPHKPRSARHAADGVVVSNTVRNVTGRTQPTRREIEQRAYFIYLQRGGNGGDPVADWLRAERELREELQARHRSSRPV